ncbi:MAG: S-layer homology domain-containing protein, partial [Defluviitaleaceae bacterium]|nr:S-layer homology domain-containing protein [Defluviitaleaceae bacterium]
TEPPEPDREAEQRAPEDAPDWLFRVIANQPAFTAPAQTPPIAGAPPVRVFMATPHTPPVNIMPEALVAVRINEDGSRQRVISGLFNPAQNEMRWHGFEGAYYIIESNMVDFVDVSPGEWFHGAVTFAAARELFEGMGGGRFEPYTHMTRAMFITVLSRLDGIDAEFYHGAATFADVGDGDNAWYNAAISWGQFRGIITPGILAGGAPNHFRPHDNITREEMAVMIANYLSYRDLPLGATLVPQFYDITNAAPWAQIPIATMRSHGIIAGRGDNTFDPASTATRAEVSQIFRNLVHAITGLN